jgi:ribosome-associated heat shock protein Hsp15
VSPGRQRIDKWLWHARFARTRTGAAALAAGGKVRLNGERINAASHAVRAGDVLTIALDRTVRVVKVAGFAERRGDAEAANALYEDLAPPKDRPASPVEAEMHLREPGSGRPTRHDRRAMERFRRGREG